MLRIRKEQMEALARPVRARFEARVRDRVRAAFPEVCEGLGEEGVRERIGEGMRRAFSYGMETEGNVAPFVELDFRFGPRFEDRDEMAWAREVLRSGALGGDAKMQIIDERLRSELRAEGDRQADVR